MALCYEQFWQSTVCVIIFRITEIHYSIVLEAMLLYHVLKFDFYPVLNHGSSCLHLDPPKNKMPKTNSVYSTRATRAAQGRRALQRFYSVLPVSHHALCTKEREGWEGKTFAIASVIALSPSLFTKSRHVVVGGHSGIQYMVGLSKMLMMQACFSFLEFEHIVLTAKIILTFPNKCIMSMDFFLTLIRLTFQRLARTEQ